MRISDRSLQADFLRNITLTRERLSDVQEKITTGSLINRPSDSPLGTSRVMRLDNQLENIDTYKKNIGRADAMINSTIISMDGMLSEIEKVLSDMVSSNDATLSGAKDAYASNINLALNQILSLANTEFDGTYVFGGTDHSGMPFGMDAAGTVATAQNSDIGGKLNTKISKTLEQNINITGKELFQAVFAESGNLDSGQAINAGAAFTSDTNTIYNADGTEYTLTTNYTKTLANTYQLDFEVDNGSGPVNAGTSTLTFDATTGEISAVDGGSVKDIKIQLPGEKIDMLYDVSRMKESASATTFANSMNQKTDIFNTLIAIKEQLYSGSRATDNQVEVVNNFHKLLLDKMSYAGSISNRLEDTDALLVNQDIEIRELISKEKDVDVAKALIDMENQQYTLSLSYKISAMILPKSIMDFI